jgi:hypothetical protein
MITKCSSWTTYFLVPEKGESGFLGFVTRTVNAVRQTPELKDSGQLGDNLAK